MLASKDKTNQYTKKKNKQVPSRPGYRVFNYISYFQHESMGERLQGMSSVTAATAFHGKKKRPNCCNTNVDQGTDPC